jgi:small multidrug resistance pump
MSPYLTLAAAIAVEVVATSALKASEGFTRLWPSVVVVVGYVAATYLLSITLKGMPMGIAYGIWSGVGIVAITAVGFVLYGQKMDLPAAIGISLIIAGVLVINLLSKTTRL